MTSISGDSPPGEGLTDDRILGGRVALWQPDKGYRAGIDAVLLAAATPVNAGETLLDLGAGAGAVFLCVAARVPGMGIAALEVQPDYAALAEANAARNAVAADVLVGDVAVPPAALRQRRFHHVVTNPPYFDRGLGSASADPGRDVAFGGATPLAAWIDTAARRLLPKGSLTLIQRAERLPEVLAALDGRLGSVRVLPLAGRAGRRADRVIVQARKEGRAPFCLMSPLVLHAGDRHARDAEDYRPEIQAILRNAASLPLQD